MNTDKHIYPVINVQREENTLKLNTFLRKKHWGKWYLWEFSRNAYVPEGNTNFTAAVSSFNRDIYQAQLRGKVDPKLKLGNGDLVWELDKDQRSEEERLRPIV